MYVLSLFDGMACGRVALDRAGIVCDRYFASEIDDHAIKVAQSNYPDIIQFGDVQALKASDLPKIDLLIGGSPCQGFSRIGKGLAFLDERSRLFFEYVRLLQDIQPKYFLLENVIMKKEYQDVISGYLGVEPVIIDSADFSAQKRKRLYWTNIPIASCEFPSNACLKDILEPNGNFKWITNLGVVTKTKNYLQYNVNGKGHRSASLRAYYPESKHGALRGGAPHAAKVSLPAGDVYLVRQLTQLECERLQTVPDFYTREASEHQAKKMLGNGWTVDVIAHILGSL